MPSLLAPCWKLAEFYINVDMNLSSQFSEQSADIRGGQRQANISKPLNQFFSFCTFVSVLLFLFFYKFLLKMCYSGCRVERRYTNRLPNIIFTYLHGLILSQYSESYSLQTCRLNIPYPPFTSHHNGRLGFIMSI